MKNLILFLTFSVPLCTSLLRNAGATIINAASPARGDVVAAITSAVDGDTVLIPAGTVAWTSAISISKAITLRGAGIGQTILQDAIPDANSDTLTDSAMLSWILVANKTSRMTGIEFRNAPNHNTINYNGVITISGSNTDSRRMRVDNCKFNNLRGANLFTTDVLGVIDHCTFIPQGGTIPVYVYHTNWNGVPNSDGSWADSAHWGTDKFLFVEDCTFNLPVMYAIVDAYRGARYVIRHNTINNGEIEAHGTDSGGRPRGCRAIEVYNNNFTGNGAFDIIVNIRSGSALIHNNTLSNFLSTAHFHLDVYRRFFPFSPWGQADGSNPWDANSSGSPFDSGVATGGGSLTLTDTSKSWGNLVGKILKKTGCSGYCSSTITSNTANTITVYNSGGYGANISFSGGQGYQIWNAPTHALDSPGRSGGTQLSGGSPAVPPGWNNQVNDPCYEWNNTMGATNVNFSSKTNMVRSGTHFFNDTVAPGYTAYTYPHPLVSGSAPPPPPVQPRPPTHLRIISGQ